MGEVTILITNYNYGQYVAEAIESALAQTHKCDIIVIDDGSSDNSVEIIKKYPVKLIQKENEGISKTRNRGVEEAQTEWILQLDADDKLDPTFIEKTLELIKEADIVGTWQREFGEFNQDHPFIPDPTHEMFKQHNRINACSIYKKEMWKFLRGYDEFLGGKPYQGYEDWDFWLRATWFGYKVKIVPEYLFLYRMHGVSGNKTAVSNHFKNITYMMKKLGIMNERLSQQ